MKRQGADLQTKIEELQLINQSLRENDKVKEDALAHLSDQLLVLSERIHTTVRKKTIDIGIIFIRYNVLFYSTVFLNFSCCINFVWQIVFEINIFPFSFFFYLHFMKF